jgi:hypothetical protein
MSRIHIAQFMIILRTKWKLSLQQKSSRKPAVKGRAGVTIDERDKLISSLLIVFINGRARFRGPSVILKSFAF